MDFWQNTLLTELTKIRCDKGLFHFVRCSSVRPEALLTYVQHYSPYFPAFDVVIVILGFTSVMRRTSRPIEFHLSLHTM